MAFNMSAWSIRHPLPPIVMAAAIVVLGCISFSKLPVTRMPNIDVPVISVTVAQVGAPPAELELRVTKIVEDAVAGVTGTHHINSVITDGISNTTILFQLETNTDRALNDVKDAVTSIRANLPRGIEEPLIQRVDIAGLPILTYAAIAPGKTPEQLSWFVDDVVIRALQGVRGVARVDRIGSVEREIRVGLDPVRLQSVGLTPLNVSRQLRGSNVDFAGGRAEIGGRDQTIRTLAGAKTVTDLGATGSGCRRAAKCGWTLGLITEAITEPRTFARSTGPVVGFNILRAKGASDVELAEPCRPRSIISTRIQEHVQNRSERQLGRLHPRQLSRCAREPVRGRRAGDPVVFLFLRDWRATIIAAVTLPLSILPSFWVMKSRLLAQRCHPAGGHARHRDSGRRRHRRDREHRAAYPDGKIALPRRTRSGRRNRACRHRHQLDHRRGVPPSSFMPRHSRPVLLAVRDDRLGPGAVLPAVRAPDHADAGGLFPKAA